MALAAGNLEGRKGYEVHARTIVGACSKVQRKQREEEREEIGQWGGNERRNGKW